MNKSSPIFVLTLMVAIFLTSCQKPATNSKPADVDYYTCTMHPSVRSQDPHGKCPICGMDLVPVMKKSTTAANDTMETPSEFTVSAKRQQQIGVTYATVEKRPFHDTIRAPGLVASDLSRRWDYVSRLDGYVEKLFVFSPGEMVQKDAPVLTIYSPELFTAEKEFINVLQAGDQKLIDDAKERLSLWNVTDAQIAGLEQSRKPNEYLDLRSPVKGIVEKVGVEQGGKVMPGERVVEIDDLSVVWVWAQFYQDDLSMLKKGLPVIITTSSYPNQKFSGTIFIVDPFLDEATRTVRTRIDVENPDFKLRPAMYVDAELSTDMGSGLAVPVEAVLPTGLHNIVFVDKGEGKLEPRFIELGSKHGDFYEVKSGLEENERVVASANFLIDAEAKVQGALKSW
jgi:Cu(I)/Ag(I) efflux system membrane fusion protein